MKLINEETGIVSMQENKYLIREESGFYQESEESIMEQKKLILCR